MKTLKTVLEGEDICEIQLLHEVFHAWAQMPASENSNQVMI